MMDKINSIEPLRSLSSRVIKMDNVRWKTFAYIQGETFKDLNAVSKGKLKKSVLENQFVQPFYLWEDLSDGTLYCLDGKHRTLILEELVNEGYNVPELLPAMFIACKDKKEAAELVIIYSSIYAKVTETGLFDFLQMYDLNMEDIAMSVDLPDFNLEKFESLYSETSVSVPAYGQSLSERFIVPPFSILDTRQGYWQERKKRWHSLGISSQETREDVELVAKSGQGGSIYALRNKMRETLGREPEWEEIFAEAERKGMHLYEGASIFDPVLCEVLYYWFCPLGGEILDPFAGGSVRGIVAGSLKYNYTGIDLRPDQTQANREQWECMKDQFGYQAIVNWLDGDSNIVLPTIPQDFDMIMSCPPYHDLEQYSDDPADLSNMDFEKFKLVYRAIISKSVAKLKENRFAAFVVSEIRDKKGYFKNFIQETICSFETAGCRYYNEIILLNVAGSLPIRVGRQFQGYRKVGRTHQNILVFYKGDPKKIKEIFPEIEVRDPEAPEMPEGVEVL